MLPSWFRQDIPDIKILERHKALFKKLKIDTVCQEAKCPNSSRCFKENSLTFMILGNICTRRCAYCAVNKSESENLLVDKDEFINISLAVSILGLDYCIVTSVTRDDLIDGGSSVFSKTILEVKNNNPLVKIEVLVPDFLGMASSIAEVIDAHPDCLAHNLETVSRLYTKIRPGASYERSLNLLRISKELNPNIITKSGIMVGLGEDSNEVFEAIEDLNDNYCDILTIGQYLSPSKDNYPVQEFISLEQFKEYEDFANKIGFKAVLSGPLVRSSYKAKQVYYQVFKDSKDKICKIHSLNAIR